jgi:uncharacterized protein (TIGR03790 family)
VIKAMMSETCTPRKKSVRPASAPVSRRGLFRALLLALASLLAAPSLAAAGGGPENVFLVVNARSWASITVANHFIQARHIPLSNVFYLDWPGDLQTIDVKVFREQILKPALAAIRRRGLGTQIDYLVYSADFPYAVNLQSEMVGINLPQILSPVASITGVTYFYGPLLTLSPIAIGLENNHYFRKESASHGFRAWYGWSAGGKLQEAGGDQYLLSTMLAYTSGRGNSVREAVSALERSATADGTSPGGTIYFMRNNDIRSRVRHDGYTAAILDLLRVKVDGEELEGTIPVHKKDVQGAMIGAASFDWGNSASTILPGAICEHFTSYGGILAEGAGQTPLTDLIRYGAAGASGTVVEPYAIAAKFPSPMLQVHYAHGCSLAESYYQSVNGPYELLIVGDPLCRPWAKIPKISTTGPHAGETVKGTIQLEPSAETKGDAVDRYELFVDGPRSQIISQGQFFDLDTSAYPDGYHELRIVGIEGGPIESQGELILPLIFSNHGQTVELTADQTKARWGTPLKLTASTQQADRILLFHNSQIVGQISGSSGTTDIDPRVLGEGRLELRAFALGGNDAAHRALSSPLLLEVEPNPPLPPQQLAGIKPIAGLRLRGADDKIEVVQDTHPGDWLAKAGAVARKPYHLSAYFTVPREEIYQFQIEYTGELRLKVDDVELFHGDDAQTGWHYLPINLAKGIHRVEIDAVAGGTPQLQIRFGGPGATTVTGKHFQHMP